MLHYIPNTAHYTALLSRIQSVRHTLWIGTADIKDLYVGGKVARDSVALGMNSPEKVCVN